MIMAAQSKSLYTPDCKRFVSKWIFSDFPCILEINAWFMVKKSHTVSSQSIKNLRVNDVSDFYSLYPHWIISATPLYRVQRMKQLYVTEVACSGRPTKSHH